MKNIKSHKVTLRRYMIRIGSLSERHDKRAQKEGFANKDGDSDDEKRKYSCPEPDCSKSYTQSHNLKDHQRKKHKDID